MANPSMKLRPCISAQSPAVRLIGTEATQSITVKMRKNPCCKLAMLVAFQISNHKHNTDAIIITIIAKTQQQPAPFSFFMISPMANNSVRGSPSKSKKAMLSDVITPTKVNTTSKKIRNRQDITHDSWWDRWSMWCAR